MREAVRRIGAFSVTVLSPILKIMALLGREPPVAPNVNERRAYRYPSLAFVVKAVYQGMFFELQASAEFVVPSRRSSQLCLLELI